MPDIRGKGGGGGGLGSGAVRFTGPPRGPDGGGGGGGGGAGMMHDEVTPTNPNDSKQVTDTDFLLSCSFPRSVVLLSQERKSCM